STWTFPTTSSPGGPSRGRRRQRATRAASSPSTRRRWARRRKERKPVSDTFKGVRHLVQQVPNGARCLPDPLFVLDEGESHVAVAAVAEADPRAHGDVRLAGKEQRELERAERPEPLRDRRPDEHRPERRLDVPARPGEAPAERVAAPAVDLADLGGILGRLPQGHGRGDL